MVAVEIVHFRVAPENEAVMLAARPAAMEALRVSVGGLLESSLYRGTKDGEWIDVAIYTDLATALHAQEVAMTLPDAAKYFAYIAEVISMVHGSKM